MILINKVLGHASDPDIADKLHQLEHQDGVERITLSTSDTQRRRLRVVTDKGTDCAITLDRTASLENGSVLYMNGEQAIVIELEELPWLVLEADSVEAALELGFLAGHLHWRVKFDKGMLLVAIEQAEQVYLDRLENHLKSNSVTVKGTI